MATDLYRCKYCGKAKFTTLRGLNSHQQQTPKCKKKMLQEFGLDIQGKFARHMMKTSMVFYPSSKQSGAALANVERYFESNQVVGTSSVARLPNSTIEDDATSTNLDPFNYDDDNFPVDDEPAMPAEEDLGVFSTQLRDNFDKYIDFTHKDLIPLTSVEIDAITLMARLRKTKASLDTYDDIMDWHLRRTGRLAENQKLGTCPHYLSRDCLMKNLRIRYGMSSGGYMNKSSVILPYSKSKVDIIWNDAKDVITGLLTDPRIKDEDYLFYKNDPFLGPPDNKSEIRDLNTGQAFRKTYKDLIKDPHSEVLLPVLFYIDGANTGHFADLPITAVKISLGIFNRKARDKDHFWGTLGHIPAYSKHTDRGHRILMESGHMESVLMHPGVEDEAGGLPDKDQVKAQDLHTMLEKILESYVKLQETGFVFHLKYKKKIHYNTKFVLFTPFIKVDSDEGEKLCGKYTSRTRLVKQLCRYCTVSTGDSDRPNAEFIPKTKPMIKALIGNNDLEELKNMSQHPIMNACYALRFGSHSEQSVHGACPMEMLHAILLGIFKYVRDCFFEQLGKTSKLADEMNAYAKEYGLFIARQSLRDMPKTKFKKGIRKGKLMAKEYPGILLVLAALLRSTRGREKLRKHKPSNFGDKNQLRDWQQLVETLLQWEIWLKSDMIRVEMLQKARLKFKYIMYLIKKVGRRSEGMGLKIIKYHAILHMVDDILNFGAPSEFDTGSNERGHKVTKKAAGLTQKIAENFDEQTCRRLEEVYLLDMADQEMKGNAPYDYFVIKPQEPKITLKAAPPTTGGAKYAVFHDYREKKYCTKCLTRMVKKENVKLEDALMEFVAKIQVKVRRYHEQVPIYTQHKRNDVMYRAASYYRGQVWRDWVMVNWAGEGPSPAHIMGYLILDSIPRNFKLDIGHVDRINPGTYAFVHATYADANREEQKLSELFVPYFKYIGDTVLGAVAEYDFYLVPVESFKYPLAMVPDIGGPPNRYFRLKERKTWRAGFEYFLNDPRLRRVDDSDDEGEERANYVDMSASSESESEESSEEDE